MDENARLSSSYFILMSEWKEEDETLRGVWLACPKIQDQTCSMNIDDGDIGMRLNAVLSNMCLNQ